MKKIAIYGKGGIGKSTTTSNVLALTSSTGATSSLFLQELNNVNKTIFHFLFPLCRYHKNLFYSFLF